METNIKLKESTLVLAFVGVVAVEYLMVYVLSYLPLTRYPKIISIRMLQLFLLTGILFVTKDGLRAIGLSSSTLVKGILRGMMWSLGFGLITAMVFAAMYVAGYNPMTFFSSGNRGTLSEISLYLLAGGLVGPVVEEIFFRGYLYGFFRQWGIAFGIIASTAIFAVLHFHITGIPYIQMAGGLVFAVSYEIEKNLLVPIIIHVTGNIALYTLSLL